MLEEIGKAVRTKLKRDVEDVLGVITHYPNSSFAPPEDKPWLNLHILPGESMQADAGASTKRYRVPGIAQVDVHVPLDRGDRLAVQIADTVASAFRSTREGSVVFRAPYWTVTGRDGNSFRITVTCPFYADAVV